MRRLLRYTLRATSPTRQRRLDWWDLSEIGLVALGFLLYFVVRGAVVDRTADALRHARVIIEWQSSLGLWIEPRFHAWVLESDWFLSLMNFVYFWFDFPLIIAVGLLLFWKSRPHYTLLRDSLLISGAIALLVYWTFPVAPPRYLTEWGFVDTLEQYANLSYQAQSMKPFVNPFAAVPSLHVGWALLLMTTVFMATTRLRYRVAAATVFVLQVMAVVATANHYLFDAAVGLVVCLIAFRIALWLQDGGYPRMREWLAQRERDLARAERRAEAGR